MAAAPNNKYSQKYTPELIKEICEELMEFAVEDRTVHFVEYARRKGHTYSWLNRMAEDYPEFAEAYKGGKELMSSKLVKSSVYGDPNNPNFNGTHAMTWKSVYSQEWKDYEKWKAEIAREQESKEVAKAAIIEYAKGQKNG